MTFGIRHQYRGGGRVKSEREQARADAWFYGLHLVPLTLLLAVLADANFQAWSEVRGFEVIAAAVLSLVSLLGVGIYALYFMLFIAAIQVLRKSA